MTRDEAVELGAAVARAIAASEEGLRLARRAKDSAPVDTLRQALVALRAAQLACELRLEKENLRVVGGAHRR